MTHPPATCELCGGTGLYSPSALPCPKGCNDIDRNGEILLRDLQQFKDKPVGSIRIDMSDVRSILKMADQITNMLAYIADLEQREKDARAKALEEAAQAGYVACAETRHVTLGDKVATAIRALKDEVR